MKVLNALMIVIMLFFASCGQSKDEDPKPGNSTSTSDSSNDDSGNDDGGEGDNSGDGEGKGGDDG